MASVYQRSERWYLRVRDADGVWRSLLSKAQTKTEARRLAAELQATYERQRLGLDPLPVEDGGLTFGDLCAWWLDNRCPAASREERRYSLGAQVIDAPVGKVPARKVTAATLEDLFRALEKDRELSAGTINKLRATLRTVFSRAAKSGKWRGPNPAADTEPRKVARRIYDVLTPEETDLALSQVPPDWRGFVAGAAFVGLRMGECAGLRKADVDTAAGTLTVRASYDKATTKGLHADVLPIPRPLQPFVEEGLKTRGSFLWPAADGTMRTKEDNVLRMWRGALARAGLVLGYDHKCRRCGHMQRHPDKAPRQCPAPDPTREGRRLRRASVAEGHSAAHPLPRPAARGRDQPAPGGRGPAPRAADSPAPRRADDHEHLRASERGRLAGGDGSRRARRGTGRRGAAGRGHRHDGACYNGCYIDRRARRGEKPRGPRILKESGGLRWWAQQDSNLRLPPCEDGTLPLSYAPSGTDRAAK